MSFRAVAVLLALPVLAVAQADLQFETFTSKAQGFSVLLPGTPKEQTLKAPSPLGELTFHNFLVETNQGKAAWLATSVDYPPGSIKAENQDGVLDAGVKGAVDKLKGKLLTQSKIMLDNKYPGRSMQLEVPNLGLYHSRIYLVGDRLYQIVVLGPKDLATSTEAKKYLDSFKLAK